MKNTINSYIKSFIVFSLKALAKVIGGKALLEVCAEALAGISGYVTYHARPKTAAEVRTKSDVVRGQKALSIVMQGPIIVKDDFTLETSKIYKKHFPGANIILSTWGTENPEAIGRIKASGVNVVLNEKPLQAGVSNINLQFVSSRAGVLAARAAGAEYVLKTRTDQRIYAPNAAEFLYNITEAFPLKGNYPKQKKRIVGCGLNTFKYRMYGLSDMLTYGHVDDMAMYWDVELDQRVFDKEQTEAAQTSLRNFALWRICEVYLTTEFLSKAGRELKWTLRDSWQAFSDHFCLIDKEQLDLYWPKYNHSEYRWLNYGDDVGYKNEFSFREWLNVYSNLQSKEVPEGVLDLTGEEK